MERLLSKSKLSWCDHFIHRNNHIPEKVLYCQLIDSKHQVRKSLLRYKDKIRDNLKHHQLNGCDWEKVCMQARISATNVLHMPITSNNVDLSTVAMRHVTKITMNIQPNNVHLYSDYEFTATSRTGLVCHDRRRRHY